MTGVDPKGLSQATFEDKIEAIAHRWAIASYNKALGRTFEDIDAIKVELRRALTPLKGAPVDAMRELRETLAECLGAMWELHPWASRDEFDADPTVKRATDMYTGGDFNGVVRGKRP